MPNKNGAHRYRLDFSKIPATSQIPNLIEVQKRSYDRFLQMDKLPSEREDGGLQAVFQSVFPITDFRNVSQLEFVDFAIGNWECKCGHLKGLHHLRTTCKNCGSTVITDPFHPGDVLCHKCGTYNANTPDFCNKCGDPVGLQLKYDVAECEERGMTYSAPLKVTIRLTIFDKDAETGNRSIRDIKEQEVFFGDVPLMTQNGTFIINGTERVIVSQLHRSPGVFFETANNRTYFLGKIIPYRGSWVEFEYDQKNVLYVRIDRKRKFLGTIFLRALGLRSGEDILRTFYTVDRLVVRDNKLYWTLDPASEKPTNLLGMKLAHSVKSKSGEEIAHSGRKINAAILKDIQKAKITEIEVDTTDLEGAWSASDIVDTATGEVLLEANSEITADKVAKILESGGVVEMSVFFPERDDVGTVISQTLRRDSVKTPSEALIEIYRKLRPGDPPTLDTATALFQGMFFDPRKYDFSRVGRLKFNIKLFENQEATSLEQRTLDPTDFYATIKYLLKLRKNIGAVDDIDHLGNRRVRAVGELLENQFRIGLVRMERAIKEKMSVYQEMSTAMPHDLVNAKPVMAAIREFFGSSQLSQFMDQTNPLSEITHKRRLSALGPGGLSRERAGFEVRDVHPTHYGRICPIETPEGPNIGLISSLSCFAQINEYGFIESPYRKVIKGSVIDEVKVLNPGDTSYKVGDVIRRSEMEKANRDLAAKKQPAEFEAHCEYLSAWEEDKWTIAQANVELDEKGHIVPELANARQAGNFVLKSRDEIEYIDVSPKQLVSVAASLIPILENDDANRALMGSNMQRQAVPLLKPDAPLVGTGLEGTVGRDSGVTVVGKRDGVVESVDAERIVVRADKQTKDLRDAGVDIYNLIKYQRSNQNTCINQRPIVVKGERVKSGDVLADGPSTDMGELALGRNVLVAFMPWGGYNFEDSILISERVVKEDLFTSVHIEEFECIARDTKLGPEEITRDIPNVGEEALKDLDTSGIIRIGAEVRPQDILVGKITPKGETQLSPEEKLLRAIFGEKAGDVRDSSLRVPPGVVGTVIDGRVFSRRGVIKDERTQEIEVLEAERLKQDEAEEIRIIRQETLRKLKKSLAGKKLAGRVMSDERKELLKKGDPISAEELEELTPTLWGQIRVENESAQAEATQAIAAMNANVEAVQSHYGAKIERLKAGDELAPGVIKMIKVFVAIKHRLQVGDKMAGRHGNKGVLSRILPEEDMPSLADGTPVDIVLNPLGVPSRMNVGQILETHLGWAARELGHKIEEDLKNGVSAAQLKKRLKEIYPEKESHEFIDELAEPDIYKLAAKALAGVHVASPVFD